MRAKDILSKNVVEVQKNEQVSKLAGRMEKLSARSAYIMDQKEFLGIFSLTNFLKSRSDISQLKADLFVKKVAHLDAEDSLMKVAKQMLNSDSFLLPVYENKEFFGVIEIFDFFEGILESKEFTWLKDIKATELRKDKMFVHEKEKISAALTKMAGKSSKAAYPN
ncbi:CBS domain-containing protein [Candidatus Woesearchaeota archaeon]|nr:CBS domain-containing protein [Candidatus Woesearchaeota archaeon]